MIESIWISLSTPFIAIFTGKYMGYPVSRNPFSWIGMFLWGILLIPFTLFIYPILIILTLIGFNSIKKNGLSAKIHENKILISSESNGLVNSIRFEDIKEIITKFEPPVVFGIIILKNKERIELRAGSHKSFMKQCKKRGIEVNETPNINA